jgi:aminopeptidase YwaD
MPILSSYKRLAALFILFLGWGYSAVAQQTYLSEELKQHITYLASDKLEGRLPGTKGEKKAAKYIRKQFKKSGLKAAGSKGFYQPFTFNTGFEYGKENSLWINQSPRIGKKYTHGEDYYAIPYSANVKKLTAEIVDVGYGIRPDVDYEATSRSLEGKILFINLGYPDANPHGEYAKYAGWSARLKIAREYKPAAIFFYNSAEPLTIDAFKQFNNLKQEDIPLIHLSDNLAYELKERTNPTATLTVDLRRKEVKGRNVIGMIDNGKPYTIVIGAHYDHLGHGEYGSSLAPGSKEIHNGADDNASGAAMLIPLAQRRFARKRWPGIAQVQNYNYLFIAFSGEEEGLLGSNYFTKHPTIPIEKMDCMLNMDMVGRLDSITLELGVLGVGTSTEWSKIMSEIKTPLKIKNTQSGVGASDHTSFYLQNIPVLYFFTGSHPDYHKPSDDENKINYLGMEQVYSYIDQVIDALEKQPKLTFQKTKEDSANTPKFKVTLGIIPDYFFEGPGLRVDGISPGKTAEKAGIKPGDIILQAGEYEVKDMMSYMEMLGKFEKGQKTAVKIKRGEEILSLPVQF